MYRTRSAGGRWPITLTMVLMILSGLLIYSALNAEVVSRRIEALPYYARTYMNELLPKPKLPPPPAVSAADPETLLQTRPIESNALVQPDDTPADLNEPSLNPTESPRPGAFNQTSSSPTGNASQSVDTVVLVKTTTLSAEPIAPQVKLTGVTHQWQTWNNCGPATITMNLSYYGRTETQVEAAQFLKPNQEDKNVSPDELAAYARSLGFEAVVRVGGDLDLLKSFLSNDLPVIVEFWTNPEDNGGMGHYRLFTGYDEAGGYFIAEDSLNGSGIQVPMAEFDAYWQVFNRTYVLAYPSDQTALVHTIVGSAMIDQTMFERALLTAQTEAKNTPGSPYAWFNLGTNYARLGQKELAAGAFDEARRIGLPYRMLWYQFDIFETYLAVGRSQDVIDLSSAILQATGGLEELYYYRGLARQALGQVEAAAEDFRAALDYNPNFTPAAKALAALESPSS
ncbi:MAG: C39 family peptidase [Anaerolineae bacterium]|nr:C39 family peptidase [Anaerolineae bacterium]